MTQNKGNAFVTLSVWVLVVVITAAAAAAATAALSNQTSRSLVNTGHFVGDLNGDLALNPATGGVVRIADTDIMARLNEMELKSAQLAEENVRLGQLINHLWQRLSPGSGGNIEELCTPQYSLLETIRSSGGTSPDINPLTINGEPHLLVAGYNARYGAQEISKLLRWDGTKFVERQSFNLYPATRGVYSSEAFYISGTPFLAMAGHYKDGVRPVNSPVYRWNGVRFQLLQNIQTLGAVRWTHFEVSGVSHLVVANAWNGVNARAGTKSVLYKWNPNTNLFFKKQELHAVGAWGWAHVPITTAAASTAQNFLVLAQCAGKTLGPGNAILSNQKSTVYRQSSASGLFAVDHELDVPCAPDVRSFTLDGVPHLVFAHESATKSHAQVGPGYAATIMSWNGAQFVLRQRLTARAAAAQSYINNCMSAEHFLLNGVSHIILGCEDANESNGGAPLYKWNGSRFEQQP
eukprot:UC1_evm1s1781